MGKFSPIGAFYLHLIIFSFGLIVFTILKNFNFVDYRNTSALTIDQINFIWVFFFIGIIGVLISLMHGYFVKTPKYYTRAGFAIVLIVIGILIVFAMMIHDLFYGKDQNIKSQEMLGLIIGSFITITGSFAYISLKFPDEAVMKYFKEAVREEIRARRDEEQKWRAQQVQIKRRQKQQIKEFKVKASKKKHVRVQTEPKEMKVFTEASPSQTSEATQAASGAQKVQMLHEVEMRPPEEAGITVVKCSNCQRPLKITSSDRPLTIRCPHCETIGVIKN